MIEQSGTPIPIMEKISRLLLAAVTIALLGSTSVFCGQPPSRVGTELRQSPGSPVVLNPGSTASELAAAILGPNTSGLLVSSSLSGSSVQAEVLTIALQGLPLCGDSYAVLSTGIAANIPGTAADFESVDVGGLSITGGSPEGYDAYDVVSLTIRLLLPANAKTLRFCFKFGTEENPDFLNSTFQDYFTATVRSSTGASIGQIARLPNGDIVTIDHAAVYSNAVGGISSTPLPPFPTPNDTVLNAVTHDFLVASCDVASYAGSTISIVFQLGDASDPILDSAVFIDCLQVVTADGTIDKWAVLLRDSESGFTLNREKMRIALQYMWEIPRVFILEYDGTISGDSVRGLVSWLGMKADGDDIVIFYFTGHGYDGGFSSFPLTYSKLADWFTSSVAAAHSIVILDTCHSGSAIPEFTQLGMWVLTSCGADQLVIYRNIPIVGGSVFTHWLSDAIMWGLYSPDLSPMIPGLTSIIDWNFDGKVSLREAFNYTRLNTTLSFDHLFGEQGDPQMAPSTGDLIVPQRERGLALQILTFIVGSPVDIVVTDPNGNVLSMTTNAIGDNCFCIEGDFNDDGDPDMQCVVFGSLTGTYLIEVVPKPGAVSSDTFDLHVIANGTTTALAVNVSIADIPDEGYSFFARGTPGDVNGNGVIDVLDVRLCLQIALGAIVGTSEQRAAADVDVDGDVDMDDAAILAEYVIRVHGSLP